MREMKDSGVEWIGEMPKSWCVIPVKFCFSITNGSDPSSNEGDTPVYGSGKGHFKTCKEFKKGPTVLLGRKGTVNIPQWIEGKYWNVDTAFDVHAKGNYLLKLFFYAASCFDYDNYSTQTALPSMTQSNYLNFRIPFMNVKEQYKIADFLDQKCSEIDALISDIQTQIETLEEYKKSVITEAVTKGLDPDVEMKDSNAELLGKIPKHWTVCKLKYLMNNYDNLRKPVDAGKRCQTGDVLYDYYGASGVIDSINGFTHSGKYLLIGEDGANLVLRNLPVVYIAEGKFWVNNHAHILSTKKDFSLSFFAYQMEVIDYYNYITGSAQPKLSQFNLNLVKLIVPPTSEQHQIADFLDQKCSEIDQTISEKKQLLETLAEYKKSLIYECVTGKKEIA